MESTTVSLFPELCFGTLVKLFGSVALAVLVWEHIGRKRESNIRPSIGLQFVYEKSKKFFFWVGSTIAYASSFLTKIDIKDCLVTCRAVAIPTIKLMTSSFHMIYGYITKASTYTNSELIYIGSAIAVSIIMIIFYCCKYTTDSPFLNKLINYMPYLRAITN